MPVTRIEKLTERTGLRKNYRTAGNKTADGEGRTGLDNFTRLWPLPGIFFHMTCSNGPRIAAEQVRPRWLGHDLPGAQDSVIGYSGNARTHGDRVGRFGQSTFRPTLPESARRKHRAGGRVVTVSDVGLDERSEGAMWGTPRKRALFGPEDQDSVSSVSDVVEAQSGWPPEDVFPEESSRVDLADVVAHLQKEVEEFRVESGLGGSRSSAIPPRSSGWWGIRQRRYPCLQERLVGTSIERCFRRLLVPMGGTVLRRRCSLCLISKWTLSMWPCWCRHPGG